MRSLFWKVFLACGMVLMLVVAANLLFSWWQFRDYDDPERVAAWASEHAEQAVAVYEGEGADGLRNWQRELAQSSGLRTLLLGEDGRNLNGEPLPDPLGQMREHHRERRWGGRHRIRPLIWPVSGEHGARYRFVVINPQQQIRHLYGGAYLGWRIGLTLLLIAAIAWWFTHYLTKPIRHLQQTSRRLAQGELAARVGAPLTERRDELGQLAGDFDAMAGRLQGLLEGQRQMLRDISHELRTPLARQRVALELARKRPAFPERELERIERESERLNELIDEILCLVRMQEAGVLQLESSDLAQLLSAVVADANFEQQRVILQAPAHLVYRCDGEMLRRAVENPIRNALKYSDKQVTVAVEDLSPSRGGVRIWIRDRGPGVEAALLAKLFEPFYRADQARQRESGGYGLGLAIAARAVALHGGTIVASNRPGGGLEVCISLPPSPGSPG